MTRKSNGEHVASKRIPPVRRSLYWALALAIVVAAGVLAFNPFSVPRIAVPTFDLSELHPNVVQAMEDACSRTVARPDSADAWGELGMLAWVYQFNEQAVICFRHAGALNSTEFRWPYYLGAVLAPTDKGEALVAYRNAAAIEPGIALVRLRIAELLMETGEYDQAEAELRPALKDERSTGRAEFRMAQIELARGNLKASLEWSKEAAERQPQRRDIFELVAQIQTRAGNSEAATQAQEIADTLSEPALEWPDPFIEEARQLRVDPEYAAHRAKLLLAAGAIDEAIGIYEQLVEREPKGTQFRTELAQILLNLDELDRATTLLEDGLKVTPSSAPVVGMLASVYLLQKRWEDASRMYERAIELQPAFSPLRMDLGYCLLQQNKSAEAIIEFDEAVQYSDEPVEVIVEAASLLAEHGLAEEAKQRLEAVLAEAPKHEAARELLRSINTSTN